MDHLLALFGLVALGFCAGAFGTLIGAGGGFVLVPLLLLLYPHDPPETLTAISLAVVFFNALVRDRRPTPGPGASITARPCFSPRPRCPGPCSAR